MAPSLPYLLSGSWSAIVSGGGIFRYKWVDDDFPPNGAGERAGAGHTFLPYKLRSSALMQTYFSPAMEKPLAKALSLEVKAEARELMSSWESYRKRAALVYCPHCVLLEEDADPPKSRVWK